MRKVSDHDNLLTRELEKAKEVQARLFSKVLPSHTGWDFAGICTPSHVVGGDYFDIFNAAEERVIVTLGDVSGKGVSAALLMSGVHAWVRSKASSMFHSPSQLAKALNDYLTTAAPPEKFITMFVGCIDVGAGIMKYTNCGHPAPLLFHSRSQSCERLQEGGLFLGMFPSYSATEGACRIDPGDRLIAYSDGVSEMKDKKKTMFGEERILASLCTAGNRSANEICETLIRALKEFSGCGAAEDDVTLLVAVRKNESILTNN